EVNGRGAGVARRKEASHVVVPSGHARGGAQNFVCAQREKRRKSLGTERGTESHWRRIWQQHILLSHRGIAWLWIDSRHQHSREDFPRRAWTRARLCAKSAGRERPQT